MTAVGIQLGWIVVKDLKTAIDFYTKIVGLTLQEQDPKYGWAELSGPQGARLGLAQENPHMDQKAGANAIMTVTVSDLEEARLHFLKRGAKLMGDVVEVPGHVKMQTFADPDGNVLQIVETL